MTHVCRSVVGNQWPAAVLLASVLSWKLPRKSVYRAGPQNSLPSMIPLPAIRDAPLRSDSSPYKSLFFRTDYMLLASDRVHSVNGRNSQVQPAFISFCHRVAQAC